MRNKSVQTLPINGPFLHSGHTLITFPSVPQPLPSKINVVRILDPQVFLLLQTTLIWG